MLKFLRSLSLKRLSRADVLIFDAAGGSLLSDFVLQGIPHTTLFARFEKVFVHPIMALRMIASLGRLRLDDMPPRWYFDPRMLMLHLRHLYFLACLREIRPKVVLTTVDTSFFFQRCSRTYAEATFIAVMNGFRDEQALERPFLPAPPHPASRVSMPHLYCCGQSDVDIYRRTGQQVDHFYPVGTLRGGVYVERRPRVAPKPLYDIVFVSQWRYNMFGQEWSPELRRGYAFTTLVEFLGRYAKQTGAKLCIACSHGDTAYGHQERAFFQACAGDHVYLSPKSDDLLSSYVTVDQGEVTVAGWSTLGVEAFGWGKRTLLCNFKGDPKGFLPAQGIWSLTEPDYDVFKARLDMIRAMSDDAYAKQAASARRYMMPFDPDRLAHAVIRQHVVACLEGRGEAWSAGWLRGTAPLTAAS